MPIDKVVISARLFNQLVQNRIYVQSEEFQEVEEVAAHIWNSWITTIKFLQHNGLQYDSVTVTRVAGGPPQSFTELRGGIFGGQAQETQGVSFGAAVLQFQTGLAGRQFRGRYYVAAYRQGATQFGQFVASEAALWQTQLDILKAAYTGPTGGSTGLGLLIHGEKVIHNTPVTSIGLRPILGVQRRRNVGVGA
jgi:hypothetical protein